MGGERRVWDCCICHCAGGKLVAAMMGRMFLHKGISNVKWGPQL